MEILKDLDDSLGILNEIKKEFYEEDLNKNSKQKIKNIRQILDLIMKIGCMIKEMLKIKLYPPYSLIILSVLSRLYFIFNFIEENSEKLISDLDSSN